MRMCTLEFFFDWQRKCQILTSMHAGLLEPQGSVAWQQLRIERTLLRLLMLSWPGMQIPEVRRT